jgi:hypothetical protein
VLFLLIETPTVYMYPTNRIRRKLAILVTVLAEASLVALGIER